MKSVKIECKNILIESVCPHCGEKSVSKCNDLWIDCEDSPIFGSSHTCEFSVVCLQCNKNFEVHLEE